MYHYETLGDERFQEFSQALISATFPNAQCLPTGQPDGGRDAFIRHALLEHHTKGTQRELIVFQVKYIRNATDTRTEREMIEDTVKREKAKVDKLKAMGLFKYYLITNLKGTAHPDSGSIDRVNKLLTESLGVEAYCWWRDDLDRRLDGHSSIKWSYPEILKATDLLEALVSGHLGDGEERRSSAIRAYLTTQYEDDQELKFKQTDLRSIVTDLFVDLPMHRSSELSDDDGRLVRRMPRSEYYARTSYSRPDHDQLNSAQFFISMRNGFKKIVLEGAPGQGKSTVTQYICQVMRMRLLDKHVELAKLPKQYQNTQVRIPFRVDLRDLAKWIAGIDPFQPKPVALDDKEPKSLEGFLAGQVRVVSGGHNFTVSDLTAVARASHLFLALDGFDEVADVDLRHKLVVEITKGSTRLTNAGGFSVQTMVTSRPAAFAKSIRFPRDQWAYFELLPLERRHVDAYTSKWMLAKGLKVAEQGQLRRILDTKLQEAHTQYLAKNPMQLTILLSLIHSRGASLPEKRTSMYDAYMDMFFSRESEKSDIVRDNRDLLVDIHRYLAWRLQTAAEAGENGSIEHSALRATLLLYLDNQGESTSIVGDLFNGIIERVGALVSRVQETYEFEVQPLREYFAARHLYETAPYSPAGDERTGTKLDRFDALVRNPYWLNVARFYGGCFSKGEISALVDDLSELAVTDPYALTSHPRNLALMLLGDWVFTQYQPAVRKIVTFIVERPHLRKLLANAEQVHSAGWSTLPDRSGRLDLLDALWRDMTVTKHADERFALANAIVRNSLPEERVPRWEALEDRMPHPVWIRLGGVLGVFADSNPTQTHAVAGKLSLDLVLVLLQANRFDLLETPQRLEEARTVLLSDPRAANLGRREQETPTVLSIMGTIFLPYQYRFAISDESGVPLRHIVETRLGSSFVSRFSPDSVVANLNSDEQLAVKSYLRFLDTPSIVTGTSIAPWVELVNSLRRAWGDCAALDRIAFVGAGVRSTGVNGLDSRLEDASCLVSAARFVRLKSGAPRWWQNRLKTESNSPERRRLLLLLWLWATQRTLIKVSDVLKEALESLSENEWSAICRDFGSLQFGYGRNDVSDSLSDSDVAQIVKLGPRTCMFVGQRIHGPSRVKFGAAISAASTDAHAPELQFAMDAVTQVLSDANFGRSNKTDWDTYLPFVRSLYARGAVVSWPFSREDISMPDDVAKIVCAAPADFPLPILAVADNRLRSIAGTKANKLLDVATAQAWFP